MTLEEVVYALWGMKLGYDNGQQQPAYIEGRNHSGEAYIASTGITNACPPSPGTKLLIQNTTFAAGSQPLIAPSH